MKKRILSVVTLICMAFTMSASGASAFEAYSELDSMGRAGAAYASLNYNLMPLYERGSISSVTPTGWIQAQYDIVSGTWLYNRCHLIGFQLTGVDGVNEKKAYLKKNLITGTRYLNVGAGDEQGMLEYENMVASYIKNNPDNHVLYRVTPVYKDSADLLASGVLMEGCSVEDSSVSFCVFCYNVQPGISIDYETGASKISSAVDKNTDQPVKVGTPKIKSLTTITKAKKKKKSACKKCAAKRSITVKYSGVSGATGYQVAYKKVGSGSWKNASVTSSTTKTLTGLSCGSKYSIKVRAYKTVNGTRTYGAYSKIGYKTTVKK